VTGQRPAASRLKTRAPTNTAVIEAACTLKGWGGRQVPESALNRNTASKGFSVQQQGGAAGNGRARNYRLDPLQGKHCTSSWNTNSGVRPSSAHPSG